MAFKSFSNQKKVSDQSSPFALPVKIIEKIHHALNISLPNKVIGWDRLNKISAVIAKKIGFEQDVTAEKVFDWINNHPEFGKTIEAERQLLIQDNHELLDTPIYDPVLARQPYYYGLRLDKSDPALAALSTVTYARIVEAYDYAKVRGLAYGITLTGIFGLFVAGMHALGVSHPGADQLAQSVIMDTFNPDAVTGAWEHVVALRQSISSIITACLMLGPLAFAPALGKTAIPAFVRRYLQDAVDQVADDLQLRMPTKDAKVLFNKLESSLPVHLDAWHAQVKEAKRYRDMGLPKICFGHSTGEFRARGYAFGLEAGTPVEQCIGDAYTNVVVMGGTGSGKTQAALLSYIRQLLIHRKNGTIGKFGMYITDAKGVLWVDIKQTAIEEGLDEDDIVVIGCEPGQYGVNVLKGIAPEMVSALIKAIMSMMSGGGKSGGNSFYDSMSATVVGHAATILDSLSRSEAGNAFTRREKRSPYCIQMIYRMLTIDSVMDQIIDELLEEILALEAEGKPCSFANKATMDAIAYFQEQWQDMESAKDTKTNIKATVQSQFGGLLSNPAIAARFFEGRDNLLQVDANGKLVVDKDGNPIYEDVYDNNGNLLRFVDVDGAFNGKIICVNISSEQGGLGATFLLSTLAARFRMISTAREISYKIFNDKNALRKTNHQEELKKALEIEAVAKATSISPYDFMDEFMTSPETVRLIEDTAYDLNAAAMTAAEQKALTNEQLAKELLEATGFEFSPQETPTFFVADEYQEMVMKGGKDFPVGDDTYWAKNRSKGVIGIIAFQFLKSIQQFMGAETTESMLGNFRNKVLLHTEDISTIEYYSKLMGKTHRFHTKDRGFCESQAAREMIVGGAFPDLRDRDAEISQMILNGCNDAKFDPFIKVKAPKQHERLSHEDFEKTRESLMDDFYFAEEEKRKAMQFAPEGGGGYRETEAIAMKLHSEYRAAEDRAMDSKFDGVEDLLSVQEVVMSRNFGYVYLQSYSMAICERIELTQDYIFKAQRKEAIEAIRQEKLQKAAEQAQQQAA